MNRSRLRLGFVALAAFALLVMALGAWRQLPSSAIAPSKFLVNPVQASSNEASWPISLREIARHDIPMPANTPAAHASFLLADKDGGQDRLRTFWFAGERESGPDVEILMSQWAGGAWTQPVVVVNRHTVFSQLGLGSWVRRLGNPVAWADSQGRTHLYVVATGLGGWAASRILHLRQEASTTKSKQDNGNGSSQPVFVPQGFLQLSPFFNLSHLVRGALIPLADGGALLPAYFELGIKYPVAIRLDANGELVQSRDAVVRMAGNLKSLQPTLVVASELNAMAYLRDNSIDQKLRFTQTTDGGKSWRNIPSSQGAIGEPGADWVINPDTSPTAIRVGGQTLLIHNPQTSGRHRLVIEASMDGLRGFKRLATLEYEPPTLEGVAFNEYSYPSAVLLGDKLHVSYTYQKRLIRHVVLAIGSAEAAK